MRTGECSFNLFGIKAGSQWSGATVNVPTLEFEDGVAVRKVERFRAYDSPADSFRDYAALIRNSSRYANALRRRRQRRGVRRGVAAGRLRHRSRTTRSKIVAVAERDSSAARARRDLKFARRRAVNLTAGVCT